MRSHRHVWPRVVHYEDLGDVGTTIKKQNVKYWTLLTLTGRHFGHVAKGKDRKASFQNGGRGSCAGWNRCERLHTDVCFHLVVCNDSAGYVAVVVKSGCDVISR